MRPLLFLLFISLLLPSCQAVGDAVYWAAAPFDPDSPVTVFNGRVKNVERVGQNKRVVYARTGVKSIPLGNDGMLELWYFHKPNITLYVSIPDYHSGKISYNTNSTGVYAKMTKGNFDWILTGLERGDVMGRLKRRSGETLYGSIAVQRNVEGTREGRFGFNLNLASEGGKGVFFKGKIEEEEGKFLQWPGTQR